MPDTTNDIAALLSLLERGGWERYRATAVALVAERNKLAEDLKLQQDLYDSSCVTNAQLRKRVADLQAQPHYILGGGRVESIDLRKRLVCAALTGAMTQDGWMSRDAMAAEVVATAEDIIAAMRKGAGDGK